MILPPLPTREPRCRIGCAAHPDAVVTRTTATGSTTLRRCLPHARSLFDALSPARPDPDNVVTLGYATPVDDRVGA